MLSRISGTSLACLMQVMAYFMSADACDALGSGLNHCYNMIGIDLPQDHLRSMLDVPGEYLPSCGNHDGFLLCYSNVLAACPTYRQYNPIMLDMVSIKSLTQGICDHEEAYTNGMNCGVNKSSRFHDLVGVCFPEYFRLAIEALASGNWTTLCSYYDQHVNCIIIILDKFDCGEDFNTLSRHCLYTIVPPPCRDGSDNYRWIIDYGLANMATKYQLSGEFYSLSLLSMILVNYF